MSRRRCIERSPSSPSPCPIYLCLTSPRDPSIVPSYSPTLPIPRSALSADRSPFQFQFRHTGHRGQPSSLILMNVATRDRLKRRSIASFAVTRVGVKNLMRVDLCTNNRRQIDNESYKRNDAKRRRNSHVTHVELREIAFVERSHRRDFS